MKKANNQGTVAFLRQNASVSIDCQSVYELILVTMDGQSKQRVEIIKIDRKIGALITLDDFADIWQISEGKYLVFGRYSGGKGTPSAHYRVTYHPGFFILTTAGDHGALTAME